MKEDFAPGRDITLHDIMRHIQFMRISVDERIDRMEETMNRRFDEVDKQFEQVDRRFDAVNEDLVALGLDIIAIKKHIGMPVALD